MSPWNLSASRVVLWQKLIRQANQRLQFAKSLRPEWLSQPPTVLFFVLFAACYSIFSSFARIKIITTEHTVCAVLQSFCLTELHLRYVIQMLLGRRKMFDLDLSVLFFFD